MNTVANKRIFQEMLCSVSPKVWSVRGFLGHTWMKAEAEEALGMSPLTCVLDILDSG